VRVTDEAGLWVHHHRAAKLVFRDFSPISPEELDAATHACFFHAYTPKQGDVAIEVGAGVGGETLSVSRLVGQTGRVIAIEAHPETYRCLKMLCTLNALDNVTTRQAAVMNQHGSIRISDLDTHVMNSVLGSAKTGIEVPAITLDDLVEAEGLTRIDFLKMNIEGAELLALQGMRDTLGMVQNLVVSCHDFVADQTGDDSMRTKSRVREVLEASGFVVSDRATHRSPWIRDALYGKKRVS
jgi:FkbM family methyltransferase